MKWVYDKALARAAEFGIQVRAPPLSGRCCFQLGQPGASCGSSAPRSPAPPSRIPASCLH